MTNWVKGWWHSLAHAFGLWSGEPTSWYDNRAELVHGLACGHCGRIGDLHR